MQEREHAGQGGGTEQGVDLGRQVLMSVQCIQVSLQEKNSMPRPTN